MAFGRRPGRLRALLPALRSTRLRHSALGFGPLRRDPLDAGLTRRWVEPLEDPAVRRDAARFMAGIDKHDLLDVSMRLGAFTRPVLLVWGAADRFFRIEFARRLCDAFPNARLVPVESARTFVMLDEPDRVAGEISVFAGVRADPRWRRRAVCGRLSATTPTWGARR